MVPWSRDMAVECVWDFAPDKPYAPDNYDVYDSNMKELALNAPTLELPEQPGLYYIVVQASWGTTFSYVGNQYIFKVERG